LLSDTHAANAAPVEYNKRKDKLLISHQNIPTEGRSDPRPVNHGYTHFKDLFNERQLLCLSRLLVCWK